MKRIIMHWTAGPNKATAVDRRHYHFIVEGDGNVVAGNHKPEANAKITGDSSTYAAHTAKANTGAIGVAVAAMREAKERPFDTGPSPITPKQLEAFAALCADLARRYDIPVAPETVLTHAEVQPRLGIQQAGKWDITWLPGMPRPGDPLKVGDLIRGMIRAEMTPRPDMAQAEGLAPAGGKDPDLQLGVQGLVAALIAAVFAAFVWLMGGG